MKHLQNIWVYQDLLLLLLIYHLWLFRAIFILSYIGINVTIYNPKCRSFLLSSWYIRITGTVVFCRALFSQLNMFITAKSSTQEWCTQCNVLQLKTAINVFCFAIKIFLKITYVLEEYISNRYIKNSFSYFKQMILEIIHRASKV